ncbi:hypothetical protein GCM10023190_06970 [Enteractinococcus fodinae]|uniref:Calcium-binding protein n=1 Tax=Enteractinococcus fodinae TaxID=684663 RepID=A0ABU2B096_9MICC|nr:calcium-binding protein [Enteractinococcus fodinae]MDR7346826.1 hypothetical protein [Enteractinococcus fodinae]
MSHPSRRARRAVQTSPKRRALIGWVIFGVATIAIVIGVMWVMRPTGDEATWAQGETYGDWVVRYTGYGTVTSDGERITLEPQAAADHAITHGGLVHTTGQCQEADFAVSLNTESQVRQGSPNIWEVGWVLWNFQSDTQFYAVALKPNGWEISKQDPNYEGNQRFLASGDSPTFPIGKDYRVTVTQDNGTMTVSADGQELATVTDKETPYRDGAVGLYTEDARVHFFDFDLPDCARSQ